MKSLMNCHVCGKSIRVQTRGDGDGIWTVFCSPKEAYQWQVARDEKQIIEETSGFGMPYDRCQWCGCTLKSGYHEDNCPVRKEQNESNANQLTEVEEWIASWPDWEREAAEALLRKEMTNFKDDLS